MATGREVLEHAFRETAKGNGRPFVDMLADDVEWSIIGSTEWSETFRGKSSVIADLLRPLAEQIDGPNPWRRHASSRKETGSRWRAEILA